MVILFGSDWIRSVQNGSKLIKLDQTCIFHLSKTVTTKSFHIYHRNNHDQLFFLTRLDKICPKWLKLDQTWSNLEIFYFFHILQKFLIFSINLLPHDNKYGHFSLDQIRSDLSKMDQT